MHSSTSWAATVACLVLVATLAPTAARPAHPGDARVRLATGAARVAAPEPVLLLTMDGGIRTAGEPLRHMRSAGRAPMQVAVVTRDGGTATRVRGRYDGWALRLPALGSSPSPPRAVIRVRNDGSGDPLSPGLRDFRFGADFRLNQRSSGTAVDNGDNLVQRGDFSSPSQYKLQLDSGAVLCRVKGSAGTVVARTRVLTRDRWYRVRCHRDGLVLRLRVWRLRPGGPQRIAAVHTRGPVGSVAFAATRPLSVGGKLSAAGAIPAGASDQFNGVVDHVMYDRVR